MSDNVIKFPELSELEIETILEEDALYDEFVVGVQTSLIALCSGLEKNTEANWEHIFDACINMAVTAGLNCDLTHEDIESLFNAMVIEKVQYDA